MEFLQLNHQQISTEMTKELITLYSAPQIEKMPELDKFIEYTTIKIDEKSFAFRGMYLQFCNCNKLFF